jgi:tetratricopeptide (TPR) repeat protein
MNTHAYFTAALLALLIAALGFVGYRGQHQNRRALAELRTELEELRATPRAQRDESDLGEVEATVGQLGRRMALLETTSGRRPAESLAPRAAEPAVVAEEDGDDDARADETRSDDDLSELQTLLAQLVESNWNYSGGEMQRFLERFGDGEALERLMTELEAEVEANPGDLEGRMSLADVYVGKVMTLSGPEQGIWGGKAEAQWREVVSLDDDHWRGHSSLGTNYSFYPSVMGKTGDAIRHLERAREIQRHSPAEPRHVQTYLYLSRLYAREGQADEAAAVLREGLGLHPDDAALAAAVAALDD